MEWTITTPEDLSTVVNTVLATATTNGESNKATVIALAGDLGAGKTTFVKMLAQQLGVTDTVTSPTFVVMKQYETSSPRFSHLVHMDAYRITDQTELLPLHFAALLDQPQTLVCIEWAELITEALPASYHRIHIDTVSDTVRHVTYESQ